MAILVQSNKKPSVSFPSQTGSIVTFNSQYAGLPLKSCTSLISGYQEGIGIPSPSNVRPLHAWSSASLGVNTINIWDEQWEVGYINETTGQVQAGYKFISKNFIPCLPNTQYRKLGTLGVAPAYYGWLLFYYYDENHNFIGHDSQWTDDGVFTTPANCHFMKFRSYSNCSSYGNDISINYPATDTSYHAFSGAVFTFGQDIYQGSIDWKRGVVVGTHKIKSIDSSSPINHGEGTNVFYINDFFDMADDTETTDCNYLIRAKLNYYTIADVQTYMEDKAFACAITVNRLFIKNTDWSSLSDFLTWLGSGHIDIAIKLSTPIEIQLPPCPIDTLEGVNNIFADTGDTTVEYIKIGG